MTENKVNKFVAGDWVINSSGMFKGVKRVAYVCDVYIEVCLKESCSEDSAQCLQRFYYDDDIRTYSVNSLEFAFKNGDEVEVKLNGTTWEKRIFIGLNPIKNESRYVTINERGYSPWLRSDIRPVQPKTTTIEWMGQELSIESAKKMVEGINKKLEEI